MGEALPSTPALRLYFGANLVSLPLPKFPITFPTPAPGPLGFSEPNSYSPKRSCVPTPTQGHWAWSGDGGRACEASQPQVGSDQRPQRQPIAKAHAPAPIQAGRVGLWDRRGGQPCRCLCLPPTLSKPRGAGPGLCWSEPLTQAALRGARLQLDPASRAPVGCPWALGRGQARPINRGLPSGPCSSCLPPSHCLPCWHRVRTPVSTGRMAAPQTLWVGLVLLGVLGGLRTRAQAHVSLQPNFQQDKVRSSPARPPKSDRAPPGEGEISGPGVPWEELLSR